MIVLLLLLFQAGCSQDQGKREMDQVTLQLKYVHQAQFAGIYMALERGYYQQEGIELTFIEGGRGIDLVAPVIDGKAQFGIAASDLILARRAEGQPIKAIAAIYRKSAATFVSLSESGIRTPRDMLGKRVAVVSTNAKEYEFQFRAMMQKLGLDLEKTELVPLDHQYKGFLAGEIDVTGAYMTGGALRLKAKGVQLHSIWPGDYGVKFYSDTIFANDSLIKENPDLIVRFLRATLKGWEEAIGDQEEAVEVTMEYARIKDQSLQTRMMEAQYPLIHTGKDRIGWMKKGIWLQMNDILYQQNVITKSLSEIEDVFTLEFLQQVYGDDLK